MITHHRGAAGTRPSGPADGNNPATIALLKQYSPFDDGETHPLRTGSKLSRPILHPRRRNDPGNVSGHGHLDTSNFCHSPLSTRSKSL